jgi:transcription elongation factor GreA
MTQAKYDELKSKLEHLKKVTRLRLMKEVATEAENGDFSENAAYQIAKGKLRGINDAIHQIEEDLKKANIIPDTISKDKVSLGSLVTVLVESKEKTYKLLGSSEVDLAKNIISHNSPLGNALMEKRVGDTVRVRFKDAFVEYKITNIS